MQTHADRGRSIAIAFVIAVFVLRCPCSQTGSVRADDDTIDRIDRSLAAGAGFLVAAQAADGAWRSDTYAPLKEGDALTALVLNALLVQNPSPPLTAACEKGAAYLVGMIQYGAPGHLNYPVYTAADAVVALSVTQNAIPQKAIQARAAWLSYLSERQLTDDLGWSREDPDYGGWSYAAAPPHKPQSGETGSPLNRANLSATTFALVALRVAGASPQDERIRNALSFVSRCQNRQQDDQKSIGHGLDDGGFFFMLDDPVRNKAGAIPTDRPDPWQFRSYGSATADGLRCLLACGLDAEDRRVAEAQRWLNQHFSASRTPASMPPTANIPAIRCTIIMPARWPPHLARSIDEMPPIRTAPQPGPIRWRRN